MEMCRLVEGRLFQSCPCVDVCLPLVRHHLYSVGTEGVVTVMLPGSTSHENEETLVARDSQMPDS